MSAKNALIMIHFGTTHDDTRELTINRMNAKFQKEFKDYDFFEAYTSRIILKKLQDREIFKDEPRKVLDYLVKEGYENVIVQSSHIIPALEYEVVLEELEEYREKFKSIKVGKPLLYNIADYKKIVEIVQEEYIPKNREEALVFVCHGTDSPVGASYAMIEYVFDEYGYENVYVVSTKDYPLMDTLLKKLKKDGIKEVTLAPFMFVAGEHAKNDMAVDYKEELEENGIKVNRVVLKGLGEFEGVRELFLEHLKKTLKEKKSSLADFKKKYTERYIRK